MQHKTAKSKYITMSLQSNAKVLRHHTITSQSSICTGVDMMVQIMPDWPYLTTPQEVRADGAKHDLFL
jgi:hypothetical protein